jgi:hypothetical protein
MVGGNARTAPIWCEGRARAGLAVAIEAAWAIPTPTRKAVARRTLRFQHEGEET